MGGKPNRDLEYLSRFFKWDIMFDPTPAGKIERRLFAIYAHKSKVIDYAEISKMLCVGENFCYQNEKAHAIAMYNYKRNPEIPTQYIVRHLQLKLALLNTKFKKIEL
jgi:hypothetical protein